MILEEQRVKQISLIDEEVDIFNNLLNKIYKKSKEIGFKKDFNPEEVELIRQLVGKKPKENVDLSTTINYDREEYENE